jgi:Na+/H+ antiporter NhaD/arsenite permease-like protein
MIPPRLAPVAFGFLLSGFMSLIVSCVATLRAAGLVDGFVALWLSAWLASWLVALPTVLVVAPAVRRFVERNTKKPA